MANDQAELATLRSQGQTRKNVITGTLCLTWKTKPLCGPVRGQGEVLGRVAASMTRQWAWWVTRSADGCAARVSEQR